MTKMPPDMPVIDATQVGRIEGRWFAIDFVIDNQVFRFPKLRAALNLESLIGELSIITALNTPRISGFNVYDVEGKLVASVDGTGFLNMVGEHTPLQTKPADPKSAGWRALPVVTPTSEEFQTAIQRAKKEGRIPT